MHHGAIRRRRFHKLDPPVLGEAGGQNDVLIFENAAVRNRERLGQLEDDVWLGNGPSLDKLPGRRKVLRVALRRTCVDPGDDGIDLRPESASGCSQTSRCDHPRTRAASVAAAPFASSTLPTAWHLRRSAARTACPHQDGGKLWQCCCTMGATSFVNVTWEEFGSRARRVRVVRWRAGMTCHPRHLARRKRRHTQLQSED